MKRSRKGVLLTRLLMELNRAGPLVEALGHAVAAPSGLTNAGWHVLSAIGQSPASVPQIAQRLGRRRQTVQVAVDELVRTGHVCKIANPSHARSPHIEGTKLGQKAFWATLARQVEQLNELSAPFDEQELSIAVRVVAQLTTRMDK